MNSISHTYRFFAITMAFLMFFTSVGFSMDMHFCGHQLKSFNLLGKAKNCYELAGVETPKTCQEKTEAVSLPDGCTLDKPDCCSNKTLHVQADQNQRSQSNDIAENISLQHIILIARVFQSFKQTKIVSNTADFLHYQPPLILRDIPVLVQSFLL